MPERDMNRAQAAVDHWWVGLTMLLLLVGYFVLDATIGVPI